MIKKEENTRNPPLAEMAKVILPEEAHRVIGNPIAKIVVNPIHPKSDRQMIGNLLTEIGLKDHKNQETRGKDYVENKKTC